MGVRKVGLWPARVLPGLCAFLVLLSHVATGLRILHNDGSLQPDTEQSSRFLVQPRRLAEVEAGEHADEDTAKRGIKHMMLGGGKKRLGIHGEGLGFAHALLESDAEVMALAAALKGGNVSAEGHGLERRQMTVRRRRQTMSQRGRQPPIVHRRGRAASKKSRRSWRKPHAAETARPRTARRRKSPMAVRCIERLQQIQPSSLIRRPRRWKLPQRRSRRAEKPTRCRHGSPGRQLRRWKR